MSDSAVSMSAEPGGPHSRFREVFREYYPVLMKQLRLRVGNEADAADIAQESYLRLLRYPDDQDPSALKALLFRIAMNLVLMRARMARAQHWADRVPAEEELSLIATEPPLDQQVAGEQDLSSLMKAINSLPEKRRQVFVLNRIHELTFAEIAVRCGISVKMVEKHMKKALAVLRQSVGC